MRVSNPDRSPVGINRRDVARAASFLSRTFISLAVADRRVIPVRA